MAIKLTEGGGSANAGEIKLVHDGAVGFLYKGGKVGIGIDVPLSQLHVKDTYSANYSPNGEPSRHGITILNNADTGTYATPHSGILFMSGSSGTGRTSVGGVRSGDGLADLVFGSGTAGGSVTERMRITSAGATQSISATGTAAGAGIDAVSPTIRVGNYNSEIVTTLFIDIGAGLIISDDGAGEVIGEDGVAAAYLTRITTAVNGIIYGGEIICLEVPTTGDPDINVVANASATLAQEAAGEGEHVLANCGVHTLGLKTEFTIPAGSNVNDYIYLTHGGTTAGTYDAGKFLLRFYGASVTGL